MGAQILAGMAGSGLHLLKVALEDIQIQNQTRRFEVSLVFFFDGYLVH